MFTCVFDAVYTSVSLIVRMMLGRCHTQACRRSVRSVVGRSVCSVFGACLMAVQWLFNAHELLATCS
eukprot:5070537-Lingulodinium_polyedra.AAC.1